MLTKTIRAVLVTAVFINIPFTFSTQAHAEAPNPDDVPALTRLNSAFDDYDNVANYAKKAVVRLELLDSFKGETHFYPKQAADYSFAKRCIATLDYLGDGSITCSEAKSLIKKYLLDHTTDKFVSFEGFLNKKSLNDSDIISREEFAYMVAQARQVNFITKGIKIHNPAISTPGPLLGPTVYQTATNEDGPVYDGSTVSTYHRAKDGFNTTFSTDPQLTLQVHPEVFKSVSVGGLKVDALQDLTAQLEVELQDGSVHSTPLTSLIPFSIHGADGKAADIRIEDGILVLVDDLNEYMDEFVLNGHSITKENTIDRMQSQTYYNGDKTNEQVLNVVIDEIDQKGFSLKDRRLMLHNLILAKTALQQSKLTPLSAPFNTIAGPSSSSRGFLSSQLYKSYTLALELLRNLEAGNNVSVRSALADPQIQQTLLTSTKILTASTLLPHISSLADAPFLPNEALSSRVKKSGALLPSEPIAFQFDRLKRATYIILDEALSNGSANHMTTNGQIIDRADSGASAFSLSASNFEAVPIQVKDSLLYDSLYDIVKSYEQLVSMISGIDFEQNLTDLNSESIANIETTFSHSILNDQMSALKIGDLEFKMDMLATPSHVQEQFSPNNDLTASRQIEALSLSNALDPFPMRLAEYVCAGQVVNGDGNFISNAKINAAQQLDLVNDFALALTDNYDSCIDAVDAPRYHQLLFIDNFQLPPFGPAAKFISAQGIEIINRILLTPVNPDLRIADIRLSYRLNEAEINQAPVAVARAIDIGKFARFIPLYARESSDPDGDELQYKWRVKSGDAVIFQSTHNSRALAFPISREDLVLELVVNDGSTNSIPVEKTITIK